jgi:hypothetical protein
MAISAASWHAHPVPRSNTVSGWRATRRMRRAAQANAAIARDAVMDTVVVLSVLMFIALAVGLGVLILQAANIGLPI